MSVSTWVVLIAKLEPSGALPVRVLAADGSGSIDDGEMRLFASFDGTGTVDGVPFDDEDVVVYGLTSMSWALAYDASRLAARNS